MKKSLLITLLSVLGFWAGSQRVFALDQQDGVYQISNALDLEEFSNMVASGNGGISGALTADIDLSGIKHLPIGTVSSPKTAHTFLSENYCSSSSLRLLRRIMKKNPAATAAAIRPNTR